VNIPICPICGNQAERAETRHGVRDRCEPCGLWSWEGRPLVSAEVHQARQHCHAVFDRLWKTAPLAYQIAEQPGSVAYKKAIARIRRKARNRAYQYVAAMLGLPEPEVHMSVQSDIEILRRIYATAKAATPQMIRDWAKQRGACDA